MCTSRTFQHLFGTWEKLIINTTSSLQGIFGNNVESSKPTISACKLAVRISWDPLFYTAEKKSNLSKYLLIYTLENTRVLVFTILSQKRGLYVYIWQTKTKLLISLCSVTPDNSHSTRRWFYTYKSHLLEPLRLLAKKRLALLLTKSRVFQRQSFEKMTEEARMFLSECKSLTSPFFLANGEMGSLSKQYKGKGTQSQENKAQSPV